MIKVSGLTKRYGPTGAVGGLTFTTPPGQVTGFLGPNGAGKPVTGLGHSLPPRCGRSPGTAGRSGPGRRRRMPGVPAHSAGSARYPTVRSCSGRCRLMIACSLI